MEYILGIISGILLVIACIAYYPKANRVIHELAEKKSKAGGIIEPPEDFDFDFAEKELTKYNHDK